MTESENIFLTEKQVAGKYQVSTRTLHNLARLQSGERLDPKLNICQSGPWAQIHQNQEISQQATLLI